MFQNSMSIQTLEGRTNLMRAYLLSPISTLLQDPQEPRKNLTSNQLHRETDEELWNCSLGGWLLKPRKIHSKQTKMPSSKICQASMTTLSSSFRVLPAFSKHIENWIRSMLRAKFLTLLQCLLALSSSSILFVVTDGT
jgi:hypothetical protein